MKSSKYFYGLVHHPGPGIFMPLDAADLGGFILHRKALFARYSGIACHTEPFEGCASPPSWFVNTQTGYRYQTTCSILTPANNAALKALAIAEGGITVVPNRACELSEGNIFSGECYGGVSSFSGLHELTMFGYGGRFIFLGLHELTMFGLRTFCGNHEVLMHSFKKPVLMHKK